MMLAKIKQRLAGVRHRQRWLRSVAWSVTGWFVGAVAALVLALLWRADLGVDLGIAWWAPLAAIGACGALAWVLGLAAPLSWRGAAARVDEHYDLKDRSSTALQFAADDRGDPLRLLQVADAMDRLANVEPASVVCWRRPRWLFASVGASIVVAAVMLMPIHKPVAASVPQEMRELLHEQASYLDETMITELRELADQFDEEESEEIDELVKELESLVEDLRDPHIDQREALARLSMMQQSITAALAQFNLEQVDSALQSLASSIESAAAMQPVAADLRAGEYDEAADKLEELDTEKLSNKEKRTVSGNLKRLSQNLAKANQGQLSETIDDLSEGLASKNSSQCKSSLCKLAGLCRKQGLRKSACQCLGSQLNRLSMCKGDCKGNGVAKSGSPSNKWGTGASNKPLGELATKIDSNREQVNVTGAKGEGPSERQVLTAAEAQQQAARGYRDRYQEFRKQAEAVLESEPLPLGHRQTVRQYFEKIRPGDEADTTE